MDKRRKLYIFIFKVLFFSVGIPYVFSAQGIPNKAYFIPPRTDNGFWIHRLDLRLVSGNVFCWSSQGVSFDQYKIESSNGNSDATLTIRLDLPEPVRLAEIAETSPWYLNLIQKDCSFSLFLAKDDHDWGFPAAQCAGPVNRYKYLSGEKDFGPAGTKTVYCRLEVKGPPGKMHYFNGNELTFIFTPICQPAIPGRKPILKASPLADRPPVIDGKLNDPCWTQAAKAGPFCRVQTGGQASTETYGLVCYDREKMYIGFICKEPQIEKIRSSHLPDSGGGVFTEECVEVFLAPSQGGTPYYHFAVNPRGARYSAQGRDSSWPGVWETAASLQSDNWTAEFAIDLGCLGIQSGLNGTEPRWRLNLCRGRRVAGEELTAWAPTGGAFHLPPRFGYLDGIDLNYDRFDVSFPEMQARTNPLDTQEILVRRVDSKRKSRPLTYAVLENDRPVGKGILTAKEEKPYRLPIMLSAARPEGKLTLQVNDEFGRLFSTVLPYRFSCFDAYFRLSYYTHEKTAELRVSMENGRNLLNHPDLTLSLKLAGPKGQDLGTWEKPITAATLDIPLLLEHVPLGESKAVLDFYQGIGSGRKKIETRSAPLRKLTPAPMEVKIRDRRYLQVNGKPYFVVGVHEIYDSPGRYGQSTQFEELSHYGFNTFGTFTEWPSKNLEATYDKFAALGMFFSELRGVIRENTTRNEAAAFFADYRKHNALLFYYFDEPLVFGISAKRARLAREMAHAVDPYRPMYINFNFPGAVIGYEGTYDVAGTDPYPLEVNGGTVEAVGERTRELVRLTKSQVPVLMIMQAFYEDKVWRRPTAAELRSMTYLSLVNGATAGISFFSYNYGWWPVEAGSERHGGAGIRQTPTLAAVTKRLTLEIKALTPVIVAETSTKVTLAPENNRKIEFLAKEYDGNLWVLAVNNDPRKQTAVFVIDIKDQPTQVREWFEGRNIQLSGSRLIDDFEPYASHVYVIGDLSKSSANTPRIPQFKPEYPRGYDPKHTLFLASFEGNTSDGFQPDIAYIPTQRHIRNIGKQAEIVDARYGRGLMARPGFELSFFTSGNLRSDRGTIDCWIKPNWNGQDSHLHYLFDMKIDESNRMSIYHDGPRGQLLFLLRNQGVINDISVCVNAKGLDWKAGTWHHLIYTFDFDKLMFCAYVDSKLVGKSANKAVPFKLPEEMAVGCRAETYEYSLDGVIDELHILDIARCP
ncbi:MAG: LamG-like jellyroll fold domain-containing protein [Phycisphaerae bacterium]